MDGCLLVIVRSRSHELEILLKPLHAHNCTAGHCIGWALCLVGFFRATPLHAALKIVSIQSRWNACCHRSTFFSNRFSISHVIFRLLKQTRSQILLLKKCLKLGEATLDEPNFSIDIFDIFWQFSSSSFFFCWYLPVIFYPFYLIVFSPFQLIFLDFYLFF